MGVARISLEQYRTDIVLCWGPWLKAKADLANINIEVNVSASKTDTGFTHVADGAEIILVWINNKADHYSIVHESNHVAYAIHKICCLEMCDEHFAYMQSYIDVLIRRAIQNAKTPKTHTHAVGQDICNNQPEEDDSDCDDMQSRTYSGWGFRPSGAEEIKSKGKKRK